MTAKKQPADEAVLEADAPAGAQPDGEDTISGKEQTMTVVYIGPTVPNTTLVENSFVGGTRTTIEKYFESGLCKHPSAKALIVSTDDLAESRENLKAPGSYIGKVYADVAAAIKSK